MFVRVLTLGACGANVVFVERDHCDWLFAGKFELVVVQKDRHNNELKMYEIITMDIVFGC